MPITAQYQTITRTHQPTDQPYDPFKLFLAPTQIPHFTRAVFIHHISSRNKQTETNQIQDQGADDNI